MAMIINITRNPFNTALLLINALFAILLLLDSNNLVGAQSVGVCYGRDGGNLPSSREVVDLYRSNRIGKMRIYGPNQETLNALRGSNIDLILDVPNDSLQPLSDAAAAANWVRTNVLAFYPAVRFRYISVGNEVDPSDQRSRLILPVMRNILNALPANARDQIKVSTAVAYNLVGVSYPPSEGAFTGPAASFLTPIVDFLKANASPLLANIYPYFSFVRTPNMDIRYALFTASGTVVQDRQWSYQNLFDAQLDSLFVALGKVGGPDVRVVVSESGWPSAGDNAATVENAGTYYRGLIGHVNRGTPRRPGQAIEAYLFAMFDENLKQPPGIEQNFGLFRPNRQPKYQLTFG